MRSAEMEIDRNHLLFPYSKPGNTLMSNRRCDNCPGAARTPEYHQRRCPLDVIEPTLFTQAVAAQAEESERKYVASKECENANRDKAGGSFGKDSSSYTNFLHLSRSNIERISELTSLSEPLNAHRYRFLSWNLETTMRNIELIVDSVDDTSLLCGSAALERFYRVSVKGRQLVEDCCKADWWQASMFLIQNKQAFGEILLDALLSYNTIFQVVEDMHRKEFFCEDLRETATFDPSGADEVYKDRVALKNSLDGLLNYANLFTQYRFRGADKLGTLHLGGFVYKTSWLGDNCAKKVFQNEAEEDQRVAEAKIFYHPNIVNLLCCNKYVTTHRTGHFIAMEQMGTSLATFPEEGTKVDLAALDVMQQMAHGVRYLHDYGVVHCDLKASNVLLREVTDPHRQCEIGYVNVKSADFGNSKVKLEAGKSNTITCPKIGTTVYMAPEAFTSGRAVYKVDVSRLALTGSEILSCRVPYQGVKRRSDLYGVICSGQRPELPGDTPKELADLIKDCWATDRKLQPSYLDICSRLEKLRHHFSSTFSHGRQEDSPVSKTYIDSKKERLPNFPCEALASYSETTPTHWSLRDETLSKEVKVFVRRKAEEHAASLCQLEITDDESADFHKFLPQVVTDESPEEIKAESSSCLETNSSRTRKRKRATATVTDDDDLLNKLAPLIKQQIEDALSSTLLPLVAVLRSREENEQKHREQMLALEEQKLGLRRQKLLLELRRGAKHPRSSHSSAWRQGRKKPR